MKNVIIVVTTIVLSACSKSSNEVKENDSIIGIEAIDGQSFKAFNSDKSKTYEIRIFGIEPPEEHLEMQAKEFLDSIISRKNLVVKKIYSKEENDNDRIVADVLFSKNEGEKEDSSDKINLNIAIQLLINGLADYSYKSGHEQSRDYANAKILGMKKLRSDENRRAYNEAVKKGIRR